MLFSFGGRIGRLQYWLTSLGVLVFYVAMFMTLGISMNINPTAASQPSLSMPALLLICGTFLIGM